MLTKKGRRVSEGSPHAPSASRMRVTSAARYQLRYDGRELDLAADPFLVGRAVDCHLQLAGGLVSRHHARLCQRAAGVVLEDLGSRNGVLVNQRKIGGPTLIVHGDMIAIGIETLELLDLQVIHYPEHLSTLIPPPSASPPGAAAVIEEQVTLVAQVDTLTEREREVLWLITLGHTQREIAQQLHISVKTVETHRAKLTEKLGCRTRAELVSYAIEAGMLRSRYPALK